MGRKETGKPAKRTRRAMLAALSSTISSVVSDSLQRRGTSSKAGETCRGDA